MNKVERPVISKLSEKAPEKFIATGIPQFDEMIGGGFYRGRLTEIYGSESVGKTHLVSKLMAALSKKNKILFIDAEFSLNKDRVAQLGGDTTNIDYVADSRLEQVCELITNSIGQYDVIILDSLAVLTPLTIESQEVGESSNIGLFSRLIKHFVVKMRPKLGKNQTALVVINQMRKPIGLYATVQIPGGMSWGHSCDVRIQLTTGSVDKIMDGKVQTGHKVHATVKKAK